MGRKKANKDQIREDRQQAKVVLKELRDHYEDLERGKEDALDCRSDALTKHFSKAQANLGKSHTADQTLIDAQIFFKLGQFSRRQAEQLQTGLRTYDVKTFVDNLVSLMEKTKARELEENDGAELDADSDPSSMNFADLGESVWQRWKAVPSMDFMYGNAPVVSEEVAKARKKTIRVKKGAVVTKPNELRSEDVEQTETDKQVAEMKAELEKRGKLNYWVFVIDPDSYSRSVESIFHSAFLVKDRYGKLDLVSEPPMIEYCDPNAQSDAAGNTGGGEQTSQFIMGFDYGKWRDVTEKYGITKCMLPSKNRALNQNDAQMQRLRMLEAGVEDE